MNQSHTKNIRSVHCSCLAVEIFLFTSFQNHQRRRLLHAVLQRRSFWHCGGFKKPLGKQTWHQHWKFLLFSFHLQILIWQCTVGKNLIKIISKSLDGVKYKSNDFDDFSPIFLWWSFLNFRFLWDNLPYNTLLWIFAQKSVKVMERGQMHITNCKNDQTSEIRDFLKERRGSEEIVLFSIDTRDRWLQTFTTSIWTAAVS